MSQLIELTSGGVLDVWSIGICFSFQGTLLGWLPGDRRPRFFGVLHFRFLFLGLEDSHNGGVPLGFPWDHLKVASTGKHSLI